MRTRQSLLAQFGAQRFVQPYALHRIAQLRGLQWVHQQARVAHHFGNGRHIACDDRGTELEFGRRNELNDPERYAWQVSGNTLTFESRDTIYPQEVLDLSLTVDGTFARAPQQGAYTMLIGSAVVVALALLLHLLFGRDRKEPIAVELYPPEGMNSAEVGYVINDVCSSTDVTSLLYEWASLGYLRMESRGVVENTWVQILSSRRIKCAASKSSVSEEKRPSSSEMLKVW